MEQGLPLEDEHDGNQTAPRVRSQRTLSEAQTLARRIHKHLGNGSITRAARALASEPLADPTSPATIAALQAKHPTSADPALLEDDTPALHIDEDTLQKTLQRLEAKRGTAAGPTQWTYEHILAATKASSEAFSATLAFINLILSGKLPRHASLLDSSLIGLQKPDNGVRPIAVGEVWCRLAGLCALTACVDAGAALAPLQLAVGISGGVEAAIHAVKAALAEDPQAALLTIDMANAFNSVDRAAVFAAVKQRVPCMLPYVQWSYGAATDLHIVGAPEGSPPIKSTTGVRQGDTLGTFLFALSLQQPLEHTRDEAALHTPGLAIVSIADDVNLVGRTEALRRAFTTLTHDAAAIGLQVQERKCALHAGPDRATAQLARDLGVQHKPEGVTVCGTPIGTDAYVADALQARANNIKTQVDKLVQLPLSVQSQFVILQRSLSLRMAHLMRTTPWPQLEPSTRKVEEAISNAATTIFRVAEHNTTSARHQMTLPLRHAGMGLRAVQAIEADAALVSGAAKAEAAVANGPDSCKPFSGASRPGLLTTWQRVYDYAGDEQKWPETARDLPAQFVQDRLPFVQTTISRMVGDRRGADFLESFDISTPEGQRGAARTRSAANGPAAAWITALPTVPSTRLSDPDFVMAGRHLLGLGVPTPVDTPPCGCEAPCSTNPDHPISCKANAGPAMLRHNSLTSVWRRYINKAGGATSLEPQYNNFTAGDTHSSAAGQKRGDILAVMPGGRVIVLDCVVTHPAAASYVRRAASTTGSAAAAAEHRKKQAFQEFGQGSAYEFIPLAVESYGRLGVEASRFLSTLGDLAAEGGGVSKERFVRNARQELSCALCRGNSHIYHRSLFAIARRVGRLFRPGCDVPIEEMGDV
jgi:hypothetical protein